jgi:cytoskeletal protein CcmA (bactofilin family)
MKFLLIQTALRILRQIVILACVIFISAFTCFALTARTGDSLIIGSGEEINDDLYLAGDTIIIDGTVNGSLYAAGKSITINGFIRDSVIVAGRNITFRGDVGSGVKAVGETINVEGKINRDAILAGREIILDRNTLIGGDLLFGASKVFVEGPVEGSVFGGAGDLIIKSRIMGKIKVGVDTLTLSGNARIEGDLTYVSENKADIKPGTEVVGNIEHIMPEYKKKIKTIFPVIILGGVVGKIIGFFMALVVGLVAVLIATRQVNSAAGIIAKKPGHSAGWGAVVFFGAPVGITIAMVSIIGIPLGMIAMLLYLVSIYISEIIVGLLIGKLILRRAKKTDERTFLFGAFVLGLFIIRVLRFIPVFGWIIRFIVCLFGLGAIVLAVATKGQIDDESGKVSA